MAVADVLPVDPSFPVELQVMHNVLVTPFDGGAEQRKKKWTSPKRRFRIESKTLNDTELKALLDFYEARGGAFDVFSFLPPVNQGRLITGLACGTGNGSTTVFNLGNSATPPYYYRLFTGTGNRNKVYKDGVLQASGFTLANNDSTKLSTVTFSVAPANGVVITVDVDVYRIMRFSEDPASAALIAYAAANANFELLEVFRNSI